jgi:eukaryotic-like serine/threonine-protein kinase
MALTKTWKDLLIHFSIAIGVSIVALLVFFNIYLPIITNHGETLTVPDARGITYDELDDFLGSRNLRYEVTPDSGFSATAKPLEVLKQFPLPDSKVKENRKIYVTLNAKRAPLIRMPKLIEGSVKNATLILQTYDLILGEIKYVADRDLNYVLRQQINGVDIAEGQKIPKGSIVTLIAGDGLGQQNLESPNVVGHDFETAKVAIIGSGLKLGSIRYEKVKDLALENEEPMNLGKISSGMVIKQDPDGGYDMRLGQAIDLWIYQPDSTSSQHTILDEAE